MTQAPLNPEPSADYKVQLDNYNGPLELLLYLIRRDEVDIKNIPIARITDQYLKHVEIIRRIDINLAGDFLVMAATLMEIKSRMLIPAAKPVEGAEALTGGGVEELADPRYELVKQLLAYKEFKDAAGDLKRRAAVEAARFPRAVPRPTGRAPLEIEDLDLFRLIDAFNGIMSSVGHSAFGHEVLYDDTPISLHQADILDRLAREAAEEGKSVSNAKGLTLRELFEGRKNKSEMIGVFLATLELIRQKKIAVEQLDGMGDVRIRLREDAGSSVMFEGETAGHGMESPLSESPPDADDATNPGGG